MKNILSRIAAPRSLLLAGLCLGFSALRLNAVEVGDPANAAGMPDAVLDAYIAGDRDITIRPGAYLIPPMGRTPFNLVGWKSATIHAKGVTITFQDGDHTPFMLRNCEGVTIEGATLQYEGISFTQGRIKAIGQDARGKYCDLQIDAGYPTDFTLKKANAFNSFNVMDKTTRLLKPGTGDCVPGNASNFETLGPGLYRLHNMNGAIGDAAEGDWLVTRAQGGGGSSIIHLNGSGHCTMQDITLKNSGFGAFFETRGEGGHRYIRCRVTHGPKPAGATEEELVSCGADGFHSAGVRVGPTIEQCVWDGFLLDDPIAIHGSFESIIRAEGQTIVVEKLKRAEFFPGEPVRVSDTRGGFFEAICTGTKVLEQEGGLMELTLDKEIIPSGKAKASNPGRCGAGFKIINCTLGNTRSRGIIVKADNGLIEGCTVEGCGMAAVSIGPEYWWNEADYCQNVIVKNNIFRRNMLGGRGNMGTIWIHGDGAVGNRAISILNNKFEQNYVLPDVKVDFADAVQVKGNSFALSKTYPERKKKVAVIESSESHNIDAEGNTFKDLPPDVSPIGSFSVSEGSR